MTTPVVVRRRSLLLGASAAACGLAFFFGAESTCRAQTTAAAEALFDEGRVALEAKNYDLACQRFDASNRLDPAIGTTLNLAVCEEDRGRLATSWELFRAALEKLGADDPRRDFTQKQIDALAPRLPRLVVTLAASVPFGTTVRDGDVIYPSAALGTPLPEDPGARTLIVEAPGHAAKTIDVVLTEGSTTSIEVAPGAESAPALATRVAAAPPIAAPLPPEPPHSPSRRDRLLAGFIVGGVGVVGLGVGIGAGVAALEKKSIADDECSDVLRVCSQRGHDAADSGRTLAAVSTVGFIAGALATGVGVYLVVTGMKPGEPAVAVSTAALPGGAVLRVVHAF